MENGLTYSRYMSEYSRHIDLVVRCMEYSRNMSEYHDPTSTDSRCRRARRSRVPSRTGTPGQGRRSGGDFYSTTELRRGPPRRPASSPARAPSVNKNYSPGGRATPIRVTGSNFGRDENSLCHVTFFRHAALAETPAAVTAKRPDLQG
jgi:hypothetical protein